MRKFKRLTMTLALLIMAVGGAWAQSTFGVKEITADMLPASWSTDNSAVTADDLAKLGFMEVTKDEAKTWTGAPQQGTVRLVYTLCESVNWVNGEGGYVSSYNSRKTFYSCLDGQKIFITTEITEWSLTPDTDKKVWTLAKMPASDVELQVEYYAESNLFLSKDALADKGSIAVKAGDLGVQFGDDGKSANTVTEGTPMTVTYNGTKKILGFKAEKKATSKLASEVTTEDIFKVIASDGMIYDNIAAAQSAGTTAQGLIVYVGSNTGNDTYTHGMALALQDEADNTWSGAKDACNAKNTSTPIVGALWIQATKDQWNTMFNAVGGDCKLRDCFSSAGGTNLVKGGYYWSGSSYEHYGQQGDYYCFTEDDWEGSWSSTSVYYNNEYHVRACIVF